MSTPYIGEIRMWGLNFAPVRYALCNGQLLAITQNTALFSILGTMFGGNGTTTFALPDFRGNVPIHQGSGQGLSTRVVGEVDGVSTVTLISSQIPQHNHSVLAQNSRVGVLTVPSTTSALARSAGGNTYASGTSLTPMSPSAISTFPGGNQPHNNMQPYLCINFCIALTGVFPARN